MVTFDGSAEKSCAYRTTLLSEAQATAFCRMLAANPRFAGVHLAHSSRATGACQWFVIFQPSNPTRARALLQAQQDARTERATTQEFTFAANAQEVYCYSHSSGECYRLEVDGSGCSCEDWLRRCQPNGSLKCKHILAWLAREEQRNVEEARVRRTEDTRRFEEIFSSKDEAWLR